MHENTTVKTTLTLEFKENFKKLADQKGVNVTTYLIDLIEKDMYQRPRYLDPNTVDGNQLSTLGIRIPKELYDKLTIKCKLCNLSISLYLRMLIYDTVRDNANKSIK